MSIPVKPPNVTLHSGVCYKRQALSTPHCTIGAYCPPWAGTTIHEVSKMHPWLLLTRTLESSYGHNTTDLDSQPTRSIQASKHDVLARREHITSANPVVSTIHLGKRSPQNVCGSYGSLTFTCSNDDYCLATHLSNGQNWGYCSGVEPNLLYTPPYLTIRHGLVPAAP